jgi:hypothetical protein
MVHAHQSAGFGTLSVGQRQGSYALSGVRPRRMMLCKNGAQALV